LNPRCTVDGFLTVKIFLKVQLLTFIHTAASSVITLYWIFIYIALLFTCNANCSK